MYRERKLLTAEGKTIKDKDEILALLMALWLTKKLAIIHCPGHRKGDNPVTRGTNLQDQAANPDKAEPVLVITFPDPVDTPITSWSQKYSRRPPMDQEIVYDLGPDGGHQQKET